ncbi:uncharacterized protein LOC129909651 [Episyrphus balteatus]|uniref:uncharacterized protein LOC129909651 n=1 Tax=Episyrphus balteatus TaxID=286459 RepID=UPI002485B870|nr:uncharacterized protein LOC129909651 [Episyrphus balteatus]
MDTNCIPTCRVCMQKSPEFVDFDMPLQIENEEDTSITYLDFFFECTRIEVEPLEDAGESSYCFCLPCGDELCSFYKFVKIAQMTDGLLKAEYRKNSRKNKNSTSHKINELEELDKNVCSVFEEILLCPENSTEKTDQCRDEDADKCPLEDGNDQKTVENIRLISLTVEPYLGNKLKANNCLSAEFSKSLKPNANELKTNEDNCKKSTTKKLIKKKSRTGT